MAYPDRGRENYRGSEFNSYESRGSKKRTGCSAGTDKNGKPYVRGWNYSRRNGLVTFYARPYKGTKTVKSSNGREWQNWFVTLEFRDQMGREQNTSGLYDPHSQKLIMPDIGKVANPRAANGGYWGTFNR